MTQEEFDSYLAKGYETPGVEFKAPGKFKDYPLIAKVVRAVLAMANRRDGGLVIVGVGEIKEKHELPKRLDPVGLNDADLKTWLNYDDLSARINSYARPSVSFDLGKQIFYGKTFIILKVHEFTDIPILCSKDFQPPQKKSVKGRQTDQDKPILQEGKCYVRSLHKPESAEVSREEDMRELLKLAIDKGLREFLERARRAGFFVPGTIDLANIPNPFDILIKEIE